jgi:hypothetical protein
VRFDHAGLVNIAENYAAEDCAERVEVARHHPDANGGLWFHLAQMP